MQILVVGAGAVGCYVGGRLAEAGHTVTLIGRDRVTRAIRENGLVIRSSRELGRDRIIKNLSLAGSITEAFKDHPRFDIALFTMKAYDTAAAVQEWQEQDGPKIPIVCLQNGIGNEETIDELIGPGTAVAATMTTAVSMEQPGMVTEETQRGIALAADSPGYPTASAAFSNLSIAVRTIPSGASLKWSKLPLNLVGNATSAILDMSPAQIMRDRRLFAIEIQALRESLWIMELKGVTTTNLPGAPAATLAWLIRSLPPIILQPLLRAQFGSARGDKLPSLALALRSGARRTEVAWLNGAVAQAAKTMSHRAPINHALALLVSDIASGRIPWEMYRHKPDVLLAATHAAQGNAHWRYGE